MLSSTNPTKTTTTESVIDVSLSPFAASAVAFTKHHAMNTNDFFRRRSSLSSSSTQSVDGSVNSNNNTTEENSTQTVTQLPAVVNIQATQTVAHREFFMYDHGGNDFENIEEESVENGLILRTRLEPRTDIAPNDFVVQLAALRTNRNVHEDIVGQESSVWERLVVDNVDVVEPNDDDDDDDDTNSVTQQNNHNNSNDQYRATHLRGLSSALGLNLSSLGDEDDNVAFTINFNLEDDTQSTAEGPTGSVENSQGGNPSNETNESTSLLEARAEVQREQAQSLEAFSVTSDESPHASAA